MATYVLPLDSNLLDRLTNDDVIDISAHKYPSNVPSIRASLLFIRNASLDVKCDFSGCSIDDKYEYLKMFMFGDLDVKIRELAATWVDILYVATYKISRNNGILTKDEIDTFISDNQTLVQNVLQLTISLPMCAVAHFMLSNPDIEIEDDMDRSDYSDINFHNFVLMTDHPEFANLTIAQVGLKPLYYPKYFDPGNNRYLEDLLTNFPFLNLTNLMLNATSDQQHDVINMIDDKIQNREVES